MSPQNLKWTHKKLSALKSYLHTVQRDSAPAYLPALDKAEENVFLPFILFSVIFFVLARSFGNKLQMLFPRKRRITSMARAPGVGRSKWVFKHIHK